MFMEATVFEIAGGGGGGGASTRPSLVKDVGIKRLGKGRVNPSFTMGGAGSSRPPKVFLQ